MPRPAVCPTYPLIFEEHRVAVTPFASGYRLGSTMEFAGYDETLNRSRLVDPHRGGEALPARAAGRAGAGGVVGLAADDVRRPADHRPQPGDASNVLIAAGHNMLGLSMAPATGKLVAEMIGGAKPHIDPRPIPWHDSEAGWPIEAARIKF